MLTGAVWSSNGPPDVPAGDSKRIFPRLDAQSVFLPPHQLMLELAASTARGVDVRVIVPGSRTPYPLLLYANRNRYRRLFDAGVRVFEFGPTMMHAKTAVADGVLSLVGSANLGHRSARSNDELTACVYDSDFARKLEERFEEDLSCCVEVGVDRPSPRLSRLVEALAGFVEPFL